MIMPGGAAGALSAGRLLGRNWPLVLLLVAIGALYWPTKNDEPLEEEREPAPRPDGSDAPMPSSLHH
jgi:hypothetical protein